MKNDLLIIIPFFNDSSQLVKSLKTIEEDIMVDVLLIDDGSDKNFDIPTVKELNRCISKIKYIRNERNLGISKTLNIGLEYSKKKQYKFIARLDAGDFFYKNKLTKQYNYLIENKETKLLGTWARVIDTNGKFLYHLKHPTEYNKIKKKMFINSMFIHPSVMFSSDILKKTNLYPTNYKAAEDYAFFFKVINEFKSENYPEILMDYTISEESISSKLRNTQVINRLRIIIDNFKLGFYPLYGILRNIALLFLSRRVTTALKRLK